MDFAHGVMVTLTSVAASKDKYGDATATTAERQWGPCAIAPRYANESSDSRTAPVIVGKVIYGPVPPVAIDSDDILEFDGEIWQVDGLPGEWKNPFTGWEPGVEVPVKRAAAV